MSEANGNGQTARWQLIFTGCGVFVIIGGALLTLLLNINSIATTVTTQQKEIIILQGQVAAASERGALVRADLSAIQRDLIEIETQFCAEDEFRNLTHANDLRAMALLWHKTFGDDFPIGSAYYPRIGRCGPSR